jgi:hypothetical protein
MTPRFGGVPMGSGGEPIDGGDVIVGKKSPSTTTK